MSAVASLARAERRRAVVLMTGVASAMLLVLVLGGALGFGLGLAAFAVLAIAALIYDRAAVANPPATPTPMTVKRPRDGKRDVAALRRALLEAFPDPVLIVDRRHRIRQANALAEAMFRVTETPTPLSAMVREPAVLQAVRDAIETAEPSQAAFRVMGPQERHMRAFVSPLTLLGGADGVKRALVVFHDETAIRRAERERMDFLANASHELRTPLTSLAGFIETLQGHAKDDPQARDKFLAIMADQTTRMRQLIDDLLSLSRVEQNELVPPEGYADLAGVVGDVMDALRPQARTRDVSLAFDDLGAIEVAGDRDELVQVVQNLVDNAVKYSHPGGIVTISAGLAPGPTAIEPQRTEPGAAPRLTLVSASDHEAGFGWITVRDRGPGIGRQHLPRLGERFFRAEETGLAAQKAQGRAGTGLGLAIVKRIMRRHRGGLTVASTEGEGTTFSIFVPAAALHDDATPDDEGTVSHAAP